MTSNRYHKSQYDSCVYYGGSNQCGVVYFLLYVDGMLIASKHKSGIDRLKQLLNHELEMKDLGGAKKILGMEITRNRAAGIPFLREFKLSVSQASETVKDKFKMEEIPYAQAVGRLMYAMVCTTPDVAYAGS